VLDSIGMLELMAFLRREYGIELGDADLTYDNFHSLEAISALVRARRPVEADAAPTAMPG
jgi:acyl carrier protein